MKYLKITSPDINNGTGCRVTIWLPGCGRHCPGCHNQWTWDYNGGQEFTYDEFDEICDILSKDYISGLTISGGDPLMQSEEVLIDLLQLVHDVKVKFPNKTIWVYTGYYKDELNDAQRHILDYCDCIVEGPFEIEKRDTTLPFRGSSNQRITKLN